MPAPRVLHISPFVDMSGANYSLLTLVEELAKSGPAYVLALVDGELAARARAVGAIVGTAFPTAQLGGARTGRWLRMAGAINRMISEHGIQLIHAHSAPANRYAWPVAKLRGIPLITHQRDNYRSDYFHAGLGLANHIICNSRWVFSTLPPKLQRKASVVHNAVSIPDEALSASRVRGSPLVIGMAGRCVPDKGQDLLITAFQPLAERYDVQLLIKGMDGSPFSQALAQQVAQAPPAARDRIRLLPYDNDMASFYKSVDVVVVPSRYAEPFGRVAIEAMAWNKATIAAGHGGLLEIIQHDKNGLLFEPGNVEDLTKQMERIASDDRLREQLASAGFKDVQERFSAKAHAKEISRIYERVLA